VKEEEYRQHADECRALANSMRAGEHRDQFLEIAASWDRLAAERLTSVASLNRAAVPVQKHMALRSDEQARG
jgi:hypothetical protein